ncbi:hypothetical protein BS47DRAFT_1386114 [Hydnum rufescens UP504]|uniref:F-box domain-containing protein n=1 Tax=Hydnum rufescens UP504 TaxID=1448309 RepID=A0A9P6DN89_9AGAM|nr:hypothetical protein BS47DRAFT_1386114 [Hydnum rufescens UP504]
MESELCTAISRTPMSAQLDLPVELLIHIFALLEGHQIVRCIAVCSYFKHAIENSTALQYLIKLDMFGYTNGPGRADAARLNQLEKHIDAWNKLDWVESYIDVPIWRYGLDALREGVYATSNTTEVLCIQLPSLSRGVPLRTWTLLFEFFVHEIEIDPSNNLLVILSMTSPLQGSDVREAALHLRTLSDNTPHPSAPNSIIFLRSTMVTPRSDHHMVRAMGALLGILWLGALEIWNWTTCEKITVLLDMNFFRSFEFLSATSFLIPYDGRLEVYEIPVESPGAPPTHTASFGMPDPNPGYTPAVYLIPCIMHNMDNGGFPASPSLPPPLFHMTEESRYIHIVWSALGVEDYLQIPFQVPVSSLLCSAMYPNPLAIPWDVWSKDVYFSKDNDTQIPYWMNGGRFVHLTLSSNSHRVVSLFDLNRSRAAALGTTNADSSVGDGQSAHIIESPVFPLGEIRMERPCPIHVASRSLGLGEYHPRHLLCDDEHIIMRIFHEFDPDDEKLVILSF